MSAWQWSVAGRFLGVVSVVAVVGGLASYAQRYARARGEVVALERQRDELVGAARTYRQREDSTRAAGDLIGATLDSLAAVNDSIVQELGDQATEVVETIVEVVPPDVQALVLRADSLRVAQVDSATARATRAEAVSDSLRAQLFDERAIHDMAMENVQAQLRNAELRVAAMSRVAQTGWLGRAKHVGTLSAVFTAVGVGSCWVGAPWCPKKSG